MKFHQFTLTIDHSPFTIHYSQKKEPPEKSAGCFLTKKHKQTKFRVDISIYIIYNEKLYAILRFQII
jgi:hypothetical protein